MSTTACASAKSSGYLHGVKEAPGFASLVEGEWLEGLLNVPDPGQNALGEVTHRS